MFNILIVEDDLNTRNLMDILLKNQGYHTYPASNSDMALDILYKTQIDLAIVDIMMPGMDGYQLTKELRSSDYTFPILMVTAKGEPQDKKQGFLSGTDDYMTKPVDEEEMRLRIKALLRRAQIVSDRKIQVGDVTLDYDSLTISRPAKEITLPAKEFYLLYKLFSYPNKIFTRMQLMDEIWGLDTETDERTVNVHINRLRDRLACFPELEIVTIRGLGYKGVKKYEV